MYDYENDQHSSKPDSEDISRQSFALIPKQHLRSHSNQYSPQKLNKWCISLKWEKTTKSPIFIKNLSKPTKTRQKPLIFVKNNIIMNGVLIGWQMTQDEDTKEKIIIKE